MANRTHLISSVEVDPLVGQPALKPHVKDRRVDLRAEDLKEQEEPAVHVEGLKELLLHRDVVAEVKGGDVSEYLRVLHRLQQVCHPLGAAWRKLELELYQ